MKLNIIDMDGWDGWGIYSLNGLGCHVKLLFRLETAMLKNCSGGLRQALDMDKDC